MPADEDQGARAGSEATLASSLEAARRDIERQARAIGELRAQVAEGARGRLELEEQLRTAQKLEAIGRLAGGVAHDFNNLLSVILSYTELVVDELPPNDPLRGDLEEVRMAGGRAVDLTRQLLAFSRQQVLSPQRVDLRASLRSLDNMLRRLVGEDVQISILTPAELGLVFVDPSQIDQVAMNLVVNARDAMPGGGRLTIELGDASIDDTEAKGLGIPAGRYVMLAVGDTGSGMDETTKARIFEPFFSTKEQGKGTGLGLATVFGIVKQSGGTIVVESEVGHGARFEIYFPRVQGTADDVVTPPAARGERAPRGNESILLVEDDDQVRLIAASLLTRLGYEVLEAQNGGEALLLFEQRAGAVDLLLTDVVMPRISGRHLAERLRKMKPELRVLFMSGYTDDAIVHHGVRSAGMSFLQKPITPGLLARKVRDVLDGVRSIRPPT